MAFNKLNKQLMGIRTGFLGKRTKEFKVEEDNFIIQVTYEKIGKFEPSYILNLKYNNYCYFQISKNAEELWYEIYNGIKIVEMILTDANQVINNKDFERLISKQAMGDVIAKVLGRG